MSADTGPIGVDAGYAGLRTLTEALPAGYYYDSTHYTRELTRIWYRNWFYVCRSRDLKGARAFRTFDLGDQSLLLVRGEDDVVRAFHNTCRHRGAALCQSQEGRLPTAAIVCPYHGWRYDLEGALRRTSSLIEAEGFDRRNFLLYKIAVTEWNGFIFVALSNDPPPFAAYFDQPLDRLDNWRLTDLVVGHAFSRTLQCNWKVFWENFNECLHCPGVHPTLSQLVPLFGRGLQQERDDPHWSDHADDQNPRFKGGLRAGAATWSTDGKTCGPLFPDVTAEDRTLGHVYMIGLPSVFILAHPDYVRVVRVRPLGAEQTELSVEFLFMPEVLADPAFDPGNAVRFADLLMSEDAAVCERNQRGLRAVPHVRGVLMPEEYVVHQFQKWVQSELTRS
jgi:Rieske 2Fe-2S family protein